MEYVQSLRFFFFFYGAQEGSLLAKIVLFRPGFFAASLAGFSIFAQLLQGKAL